MKKYRTCEIQCPVCKGIARREMVAKYCGENIKTPDHRYDGHIVCVLVCEECRDVFIRAIPLEKFGDMVEVI